MLKTQREWIAIRSHV